jgi:hypothetical protein
LLPDFSLNSWDQRSGFSSSTLHAIVDDVRRMLNISGRKLEENFLAILVLLINYP